MKKMFASKTCKFSPTKKHAPKIHFCLGTCYNYLLHFNYSLLYSIFSVLFGLKKIKTGIVFNFCIVINVLLHQYVCNSLILWQAKIYIILNTFYIALYLSMVFIFLYIGEIKIGCTLVYVVLLIAQSLFSRIQSNDSV